MTWAEYEEAKRCRDLDHDINHDEEIKEIIEGKNILLDRAEKLYEAEKLYDKEKEEEEFKTLDDLNNWNRYSKDFAEEIQIEKLIREKLERRNEEPVNEVEKQNYYNRNGIEAKDIISAIYQFYGSDLSSWESACIYNIIKYLMRYKYKENPEKDLDKLVVNVNWLKKEI